MMFIIIRYDEFYNIPMRGIAKMESHTLAFFARLIHEEPIEIKDRPGIYSRIICFECDENLLRIFEEKDEIFRQWRALFDAGLVDKMTHPLYTDPRYQELSKQIDSHFEQFETPIIEKIGLMRVEVEESGKYVLDCI